ncbi:hypothetical protein QJQ45_018273 [Haematococcus lacustris]|nr:hypothetical protein QJQ45_018273 [Haematococcus lacustris]
MVLVRVVAEGASAEGASAVDEHRNFNAEQCRTLYKKLQDSWKLFNNAMGPNRTGAYLARCIFPAAGLPTGKKLLMLDSPWVQAQQELVEAQWLLTQLQTAVAGPPLPEPVALGAPADPPGSAATEGSPVPATCPAQPGSCQPSGLPSHAPHPSESAAASPPAQQLLLRLLPHHALLSQRLQGDGRATPMTLTMKKLARVLPPPGLEAGSSAGGRPGDSGQAPPALTKLLRPSRPGCALLSIDLEWWERDHSLLLELGWHWIVEEGLHRHNGRYVPDARNAFRPEYGQSETGSLADGLAALQADLDQALLCRYQHPLTMTAAGNVQSIGQAAGASPDQQGSLGVWQEADQGANSDGWFMGLVGHGMREDIRQLHAAGVKLPPGLVQVDTQELLHAVLGCRSQAQMSLASLLRWLQVPGVRGLHNAGNDARLTMEACLRLATTAGSA